MSSRRTARAKTRLTLSAADQSADQEALQRLLVERGLVLTQDGNGFRLDDLESGASYYYGSTQGVATPAMVTAAAGCVLTMRQALRSAKG